MVFSHKCILCKAHFRNQPGFVRCNVSPVLSRGNMKQMSSELVDREARKQALYQSTRHYPAGLASSTAPLPELPVQLQEGSGVSQQQGEGRAGQRGTRNPHSCATGSESTYGQPKITGISWRPWGTLGAASELSEDKRPPDSPRVEPRDS